MRNKKLLTISVESLYGYKNPVLKANLLEAIADFRQSRDTDALAIRLQDIGRRIFNINLKVNVVPERAACYVLFEQPVENILNTYKPAQLTDKEHSQGRGVSELESVVDGWIDLDSLRVGGVFADLQVWLTITSDIDSWSDDDYGVAYLHELGHYLGYVKMAATQYRYYGVVDSLVRGIRGAETNRAAVDFVRSVSGEYGFTITDPEDLKTVGTNEALRVQLFDEIRVSDKNGKFTGWNFDRAEYIADELPAAIFGPRQAAVAIAGVLQRASHPAYRAPAYFYGRTFAAIAGVFASAVLFAPVAVLFGVALAADQLDAASAMNHVPALTRLQHFRALLLSDAKSPETTKERARAIAADLTLIDAEIAKLKTCNVSIVELISKLVDGTRRKRLEQDEYDAALLELQNNPLFLRAHQMRELTGGF